MFTVESIGGERAGDAVAATLAIPRALYHALFVDVQNGEASIAGGMDAHMDITGTDARLSVSYPAGNDYDYLMRFERSHCVVGISENARDYTINVQRVTDSGVSFPNEAPFSGGSGSNAETRYINGTGGAQITVQSLDKSDLAFVFVR